MPTRLHPPEAEPGRCPRFAGGGGWASSMFSKLPETACCDARVVRFTIPSMWAASAQFLLPSWLALCMVLTLKRRSFGGIIVMFGLALGGLILLIISLHIPFFLPSSSSCTPSPSQ